MRDIPTEKLRIALLTTDFPVVGLNLRTWIRTWLIQKLLQQTCLKLSKPSVDKVFTCCHCEKEFSDFNDRVQHYRQDHQRKEIGVQEKTLKCCLCDESFINTELRSQHYNEHNIDNDAVSRQEQGNGDV